MLNFFAKSTTQENPAERIGLSGSNVLGATGLSRSALRQYVSRYGVFGRDSGLNAAEQATVRTVLGKVPQNAALAANDRYVANAPVSRLQALREFAAAAVCGRGTVTRADWKQAEAAGLSQALRGEVLAAVGLVKETFGLERTSNCDEVRVGRIATQPELQLRAA